MDYKQEVFYRNPGQNMSKVPFYMAYPMQTVYMEEMEYARDLEKLKGMYPKEVRSIQEMVEDECDKMEYEGSLMFDEYPDRVMVDRIVKRIYQTAAGDQPMLQKVEVEQSDTGQYEREQYEEGAYEEYQKLDMEAEELPLEGTLVHSGDQEGRQDRRQGQAGDREDRRDRRQGQAGDQEGRQDRRPETMGCRI